MAARRLSRGRTLALYCPDINLPLGIDLPSRAALRGGKAGLIHWARALANRGFEVTIFAGNAVRGTQDLLSVRGLNECQGSFDVLVFHTGQVLHFQQPEIDRLEGKVRILWLRGPVRVAEPDGPLDFVVAESVYVKKLAESEWGFPSNKLRVIRGEAVLHKFPLRAIRNTARDPFLGVYLSTPEKGFHNIFTVLDSLYAKGLRFRLLVFGDTSFWDKAAKPANIPWLHFAGDIPQDNIPETLLGCGFMPYFVDWADGCSLATAEAMSAGVVVFASNHGSNAELVADRETGFLVPVEAGKPNLSEAAALLELYLRQPEKFESIRLAAAKSIPTWQERAVEWETLLLRALERQSQTHVKTTEAYNSSAISSSNIPDNDSANIRQPARRLSVLLAGDFGVSNIGDDAILLSNYELLKARHPHVSVTVVAPKPGPLSFLQTPALSLFHWPKVEEAIATSDLVVIGGGGLFHDWWAFEPEKLFSEDPEGPTAYLSLVARATRLNKPCLLFGVGVGPLRSEGSLKAVAEVLSNAYLVTVRDKASFELLDLGGVTKSTRVAVTADPAFDLPHRHPPRDKLWSSLGLGEAPRPVISVILRGWDVTGLRSQFLAMIGSALKKVLHRVGGLGLYIPFQTWQGHPWTDDIAVGFRLREYVGNGVKFYILPHLGPWLADAVISASDVVIAMRYHAVVFAFRHSTPVLGFAYDPKLSYLFLESSLSRWCWPLSGWDETALVDAIEKLLLFPSLQRERQRAYCQAARQRLAVHGKELDEFLYVCGSGEKGLLETV